MFFILYLLFHPLVTTKAAYPHQTFPHYCLALLFLLLVTMTASSRTSPFLSSVLIHFLDWVTSNRILRKDLQNMFSRSLLTHQSLANPPEWGCSHIWNYWATYAFESEVPNGLILIAGFWDVVAWRTTRKGFSSCSLSCPCWIGLGLSSVYLNQKLLTDRCCHLPKPLRCCFFRADSPGVTTINRTNSGHMATSHTS